MLHIIFESSLKLLICVCQARTIFYSTPHFLELQNFIKPNMEIKKFMIMNKKCPVSAFYLMPISLCFFFFCFYVINAWQLRIEFLFVFEMYNFFIRILIYCPVTLFLIKICTAFTRIYQNCIVQHF